MTRAPAARFRPARGPRVTRRDIDNPKAWALRLKLANKKDCEKLVYSMSDIGYGWFGEGIQLRAAIDRFEQGRDVYEKRFGESLVPF